MTAIISSPAARTTNPMIIGHRYPVRRSVIAATPAIAIMPTARAVSRVPEPSAEIP